MSIRAYQPNDWELIFDIFSRAKPDEFHGSVERGYILPLEKDENILKSFHESISYGSEQNNRINGFAGYNRYLKLFLFTDPDFYKQGVATRFLEYILPQIGNKAWLLVLKTNLPAINLYNQFGFSVAEEFNGKSATF